VEILKREMEMLSILRVAMTATALFVTATPLAYAQAPATGAPPEWAVLTDERIEIVKAALQLNADQEKYWPDVENAIRNRAKNRQARIATTAERLSEMAQKNPVEVLRSRDPIAFMRRRADALAQRADDLKKLADAWQPLYQTLSPDQKKRLALLTILVIREVRNPGDQRRERFDDEDDD
jgi:LTXXQ motif family protein